MVGWHHQLDGHEFEQTLGVGDGQGGLVGCSPWGHKESNMTEWLNWTEVRRRQIFQGRTSYSDHLLISQFCLSIVGFPGGSAGKESACNAGDLGSIPGLGRSPGEGKGYPLQYSGLQNSMDCIVHRVAKSRTPLSNSHFTSFHLSLGAISKWIITTLLSGKNRNWSQKVLYGGNGSKSAKNMKNWTNSTYWMILSMIVGDIGTEQSGT